MQHTPYKSLHSHQLLSKLSFENTGLCTMSRAQKLLKSVASLKHEFGLHIIWHKLIVSIIEKKKLWCVNASTKTTTKKKNKNICEPIYKILTWLLFDKLSKISISNEQVIFRDINVYMHAIITNEKRSHGFEGELRGIYGRIWKEERGDVLQLYYNLKSKTLKSTEI